MATQPQATAGGPRQQQLLLVAALTAVLALVLGLLVLRPLLRGQAEEVATPPAVTAGAAPTPTTTAPSTQLIGPSTTLSSTGGAAGSAKDPFKPLVTTGSAAATGSAEATTESGLTATTVPGAGAGTATAPAGGSAERKVTLASVANGRAKVTVDGTAYTVTEGERFAEDYRAVDIGDECATFESGTTPFTLCEGEAVLK
jgi:hypothetical protein